MARIKTYKIDNVVDPDDILLGSDSATNLQPTRNYRVGDLLLWFSQNLADNLAYRYSDGNNPEITYNTRGYFFSDTNIVKEITKLYINDFSQNGTDYKTAYNTFINEHIYIKIVDVNDNSKFGYLEVLQATKENNKGYFEFDVKLIGNLGYGLLTNEVEYFFVFAPISFASNEPVEQIEKTSEIPINDGEDGINPYISLIDIYKENKLISYAFTHLQNYDYYVWADKYIINNVVYSDFISAYISLSPSDPDFDRIDVFVVNENGTITVVEGVPSADPVQPSVSENQLEVRFVIVKAASTEPEPTDSSKELIYDENAQQIGGEANTLSNSGNIDLENTIDAYKNLKSIRFLNAGNGNSVTFTSAETIYKNDFDNLVFFIKNINTVNHRIEITFKRAAGISVTLPLQLTNGKYGYNRLNTTDWQIISIPVADLRLSAEPYSSIIIRNLRVNASFYIDYIFLQKNSGQGTVTEIEKTSDIPINDGEDGTSRYTQETDFKTVGGQSIIGSGNITIVTGGVQTVTGDGVGGTPEDVVLTFPTPAEINAQEKLVSGTNIKTVNNESLLGSGNIEIQGVTTYDELTDKSTVDLPTINTPLSNALNDKQKKLIAGSNITLLPDGTISAEPDGVQSVTGDGVGGTTEDVVLTFPTPADIGTYNSSEIDELISPKQKIKTGNYTLTPSDNDATISMDGGVCTINPNTQTYPDAYVIAQKNITDAIAGSIVCSAKSGWSYKINDTASVVNGIFTFPAGATCTIVKFKGTNKIYIDGGVE